AIQALRREGRDVGIAALVDTDREHLAQCARAWHIAPTFTELNDALADTGAEAVLLATPHHLHRAGAEAAAAGGRHVLVEKPMALTLDDADAMIAACRRAGVMLMVLESVRYQRGNLLIAEALQRGVIGQVLSGRIDRIGRGRHTYQYPGRRAWLADPDVCGGGIWMVNGVHLMSQARMFFGEVVRIDAREVRSDRFDSPLEATVVALVEFDSHAVATLTLSAELHGYGRWGDLAVFGADGTLGMTDRGADTIEIHREGRQAAEILDCTDPPRDGADGYFVRQIEEFLAAVAEGRQSATSGVCERASLAAVLAGYESLRTGLPVSPQAPLLVGASAPPDPAEYLPRARPLAVHQDADAKETR
ncbi:MAG: Gfo/Idh/MocA family oxidoreductase, partial [Planctomycetes bacterium]|nr:Gfo/Idh/MocA family oxidoreductase [Planctomycetota bacterium]